MRTANDPHPECKHGWTLVATGVGDISDGISVSRTTVCWCVICHTTRYEVSAADGWQTTYEAA